MKRKNSQPDLTTVAGAVRAIRARLGLNMIAFAEKIGVTHGQVSRYEAGLAVPGYLILSRLLRLSEGPERAPVVARLAVELGRPGVTEPELLNEIEKESRRRDTVLSEIMWGDAINHLPPPDPSHPEWQRFAAVAPGLAELLRLVSVLYSRKKDVDPALPELVRLWLEYADSDPKMRQIFHDAAQYVGVLLEKNVRPDTQRPATAKAKKTA